MQIFQPFASFDACAAYLRRDPKRLGKQAVELYQIYNAVWGLLRGERPGYRNHPVVRHIFHGGHPYDLFPYFDALTVQWRSLGYRRSPEFLWKVEALYHHLTPYFTPGPYLPFFCSGEERSYEDVFRKYRALLHNKWYNEENAEGGVPHDLIPPLPGGGGPGNAHPPGL
ncbi:pyrimidine dimer DNA glycosylase/endonuclease V [Zongyangia hominis]|uniref:Uncharacterized protein n=1 Tax=Zongyangia hominis TaxID=2763677 RepID=A0A926I6S0_9FIRM|nr:pyrimidine dimer DNA glycosylase/endonuclease V [Zongyangia hominis]MBC8570344.1 hypothetical protein [Zongyangia hominis]